MNVQVADVKAPAAETQTVKTTIAHGGPLPAVHPLPRGKKPSEVYSNVREVVFDEKIPSLTRTAYFVRRPGYYGPAEDFIYNRTHDFWRQRPYSQPELFDRGMTAAAFGEMFGFTEEELEAEEWTERTSDGTLMMWPVKIVKELLCWDYPLD